MSHSPKPKAELLAEPSHLHFLSHQGETLWRASLDHIQHEIDLWVAAQPDGETHLVPSLEQMGCYLLFANFPSRPPMEAIRGDGKHASQYHVGPFVLRVLN